MDPIPEIYKILKTFLTQRDLELVNSSPIFPTLSARGSELAVKGLQNCAEVVVLP